MHQAPGEVETAPVPLWSLMRFLSLRLKPKAAARPRIGRGPGTELGVGVEACWVMALLNDVKALDLTVKVLVKADEMVLELKVDGEKKVLKALIAPLGLGLGAELVAVTVETKPLPMMTDEPSAAH